MRKAYIPDWRDKANEGMRTPIEVFLTFVAEEAHLWPSKEHAQSLCTEFNSYRVKVPWAEDGDCVCKGFQVEERVSRFLRESLHLQGHRRERRSLKLIPFTSEHFCHK
jgi:hypothetical protein